MLSSVEFSSVPFVEFKTKYIMDISHYSFPKLYVLLMPTYVRTHIVIFLNSEKFTSGGIFRCSDRHCLKRTSDQYKTFMFTTQG